MGGNRSLLIDALHGSELFDERFAHPQVVNCDPATGAALSDGGCLSVVFKALDTETALPVALKFFDPDRLGPSEQYRQDLFKREAELASLLQGVPRCLQQVCPLREFRIDIPDYSGTRTLQLPCQYFATEWLDQNINDYFVNHDAHSATTKLHIFRELTLALQALHQRNLFHRDLKHDNFRVANRDSGPVIVTIDLGTAANRDSAPIGDLNAYANPVGAPAFSPPEAFSGLASDRDLGPLSDMYGLGNLLHDLFNEMNYMGRIWQDSGFQRLVAAAIMLAQSGPVPDRRSAWDAFINSHKRVVTLPGIDGPRHTVPNVLLQPLTDILHGLTKPDYRDRWRSFDYLLRRIDSALRLAGSAPRNRRNHLTRRT